MTPEQRRIYNTAYRVAHREQLAKYALARKEQRAICDLANRDNIRARAARWNAAHHDKCGEYAARYRAANRDKRRAVYSRWAKANYDKVRAWRAANRNRVCAYERKRRATKAGAEGTHTVAEWRALGWSVGWRCKYCDAQLTPATATEEHMTPLCRGGSDWIANIAVSCQPCNSSKHISTVAEFLARRRAAQKETTDGTSSTASQTESTLNRPTEGDPDVNRL
jgi:hypothetical protein